MSLDVRFHKNLKGFSLDAGFCLNGEMLGILGASGCGKSLTLKCIAGIETPDEGKILLDGRALFDSQAKTNIKPQRRKVGYLFQNYALFPNMTVEENIGCALRGPRAEQRRTVEALIRRFHLEGLGQRYPGKLSGGQQQRVALARILAYEPDALLLDEPFSALDSHLKEQLQVELLDFLRGYAGEIVLVTHSRDEAYRLCSRLLVMEQGKCIAFGETKKLFQNPGLLPVARLTGCKNFSKARQTGDHTVYATDWDLHLTVQAPIPRDMDCIGIRAHDFAPADGDEKRVNRFAIRIQEKLEGPFDWSVLFTKPNMESAPPIWWIVSKERLTRGTPGFLSVEPQNVLLLSSGDGQTK